MVDIITSGAPNLSPGPTPILNFQYHIQFGEHTGKIIGHTVELRFMGHIFYGPSYFPSDSSESYINNVVSIPMYQNIFESFEKLRNKQDKLTFMTNVKLHIIRDGGISQTQSLGSSLYDMSLTEWFKYLETAGYCNRKIIEIAIPTMPHDGYKTIIEHINQAEQFRRTGHHKECVDECREAQEALNKILTGKDNPYTEMDDEKIKIMDRMGPDKKEDHRVSHKVQEWRSSTWNLGHIGHHDGYSPTPEMAESVYLSTLALLSFLSKLHAESLGQWPNI